MSQYIGICHVSEIHRILGIFQLKSLIGALSLYFLDKVFIH